MIRNCLNRIPNNPSTPTILTLSFFLENTNVSDNKMVPSVYSPALPARPIEIMKISDSYSFLSLIGDWKLLSNG